MRIELEEKVIKSQLLIRHAYRHCRSLGVDLELAYSGGKDSDVLLDLCRSSRPEVHVRPIYRCTTIDPPFTISHCLSNGVEVMRPRRSFFDCIVRNGFPTMFKRHCCLELKEYAVCDYVLVGVRCAESVRRSKRYTCDSDLVTYKGRGRAMQYYPLLDWEDDDIAEYIAERGIVCHPLYYDEQGNFHVERRLGCIGCPLAYFKKRILDFERYPRMVRFWCRAGKRFMDGHPDSYVHGLFDDVFEWFVCELFYGGDIDAFRVVYPRCSSPVIGQQLDMFSSLGSGCREFLEQRFGIDLSF